MIIAKVISADGNRLAVNWQKQQLQIGLHNKTQYKRGGDKAGAADIKPGEQIIVSMMDRGGNLSATYVYLAKANIGGNPCNPCNPCGAKKKQ